MRFFAVTFAILAISTSASADELVVHATTIDDRKAVIATVEPVHQLVARARIGGSIVSMKVKEGDRVAGGAEIATIADEKLMLQMKALASRLQSQEAQRDLARADFERIQELQRRGVSTQTQLDQAKTRLEVAERMTSAMRSEREVVAQQITEGTVLAPGPGRVLNVPVSEGRVVLPGETIATLAQDDYILRLQLPERHAQFMRAGDKVLILSRGQKNANDMTHREGRVIVVYPEIRGGRVIADVEVAELGDYFVGERVRVDITTGKREVIMIPQAYVYRRAGVNYVRLKSGAEIVVQPGETRDNTIEILAGLSDGDILVTP